DVGLPLSHPAPCGVGAWNVWNGDSTRGQVAAQRRQFQRALTSERKSARLALFGVCRTLRCHHSRTGSPPPSSQPTLPQRLTSTERLGMVYDSARLGSLGHPSNPELL